MPDLTILHTAQIHCATFDALAPDADLTHVVRADWLDRAQGGIDPDLRAEITQAVWDAEGPVLCSCTTIGEVAETAGATRIDWPMMQEAARLGAPTLMVYCLESTRRSSENLLRRAFGKDDPDLSLLFLGDQWPLFASGDPHGFAQAIAQQIERELAKAPYCSIVLAQASMAGAADLLRARTDIPVLASPELAVRACLGA